MVAKYFKEDILNVHMYWNEKSDDLDNILFKQNGILVKNLYCGTMSKNSAQSKIDVDALVLLGTTLLNDQNIKHNFYHIVIPSKECFLGDHAVAMAVDNKNKTIYYHDSHGEDMRKEMKDFLALLLPDYKIDVNFSKQQQDVVNPLKPEENDNSCVLLTKYNLRDMWYKISGKKDKICNFSSVEARANAWDILKDIQKEEQKTVVESKKSTFKIGIKKMPTKEEIEARKQREAEDFKYRMYNQSNYIQLLQQAVQRSKSGHIAWCNRRIVERDFF